MKDAFWRYFNYKDRAAILFSLYPDKLERNVNKFFLERIKPGVSRDYVLSDFESFLRDEMTDMMRSTINLKLGEVGILDAGKFRAEIASYFYSKFTTMFGAESLQPFDYLKTYDPLFKESDGVNRFIIRNSPQRDRKYLSESLPGKPFSSLYGKYVDSVKSIIAATTDSSGVLSVTRAEMRDRINAELELMGKRRYAYTLLNTHLQTVSRMSEGDINRSLLKLEYGVYMHVIQDSRDFCVRNAGRVLPWVEWENMTNDLGDVDITVAAGGYHCPGKVYVCSREMGSEVSERLRAKFGDTADERRALAEKKHREKLDAQNERRREIRDLENKTKDNDATI